jgi:hypothetical protein
MNAKDYLFAALAPVPLLLVRAVAMRPTADAKWTGFDFFVAWVMLAGAVFTYRFLASRKIASFAYRAASVIAIGASLMLIWVNLAVGFIGNENSPANLLYGGVLATGLLGSTIARFQPAGLARTLFAMAGVQFFVPVVAFLTWRPDFDAGVTLIFLLNGVWVLLFTVAGLLFRHAAAAAPGRTAA